MEDDVPFTSKNPTYLTPEQRYALMQIPADLSDREIAPQTGVACHPGNAPSEPCVAVGTQIMVTRTPCGAGHRAICTILESEKLWHIDL
jgi:hypothetical protein